MSRCQRFRIQTQPPNETSSNTSRLREGPIFGELNSKIEGTKVHVYAFIAGNGPVSEPKKSKTFDFLFNVSRYIFVEQIIRPNDPANSQDLLFVYLKNGSLHQMTLHANDRTLDDFVSKNDRTVGFINPYWMEAGISDLHKIEAFPLESKYGIDFLIHTRGSSEVIHAVVRVRNSNDFEDIARKNIEKVIPTPSSGESNSNFAALKGYNKRIVYIDFLFNNLILVVLSSGEVKVANLNEPANNYSLPVTISEPEKCDFEGKWNLAMPTSVGQNRFDYALLISSFDGKRTHLLLLAADKNAIGEPLQRTLEERTKMSMSELSTGNKIQAQLFSFPLQKITAFEFINGQWTISVFESETKFNEIQRLTLDKSLKTERNYNHFLTQEHDWNWSHLTFSKQFDKLAKETSPRILKDMIFAPNLFTVEQLKQFFFVHINQKDPASNTINYYYANFERFTEINDEINESTEIDPKIAQTSNSGAFEPELSAETREKYKNVFTKLTQMNFQSNEIVLLAQAFAGCSEIVALRKNNRLTSFVPSPADTSLINFLKRDVAIAAPILCYNIPRSDPERVHNQFISRDSNIRIFKKSKMNFGIELLKRLLFAFKKTTKYSFHSLATLEDVAMEIVYQKRTLRSDVVSVHECFKNIVVKASSQIQDSKFALQALAIQNKEETIGVINDLLSSFEQKPKKQFVLRFYDNKVSLPKIETRAFRVFYVQFLKHCEAQFSKLYLAALLISFLESAVLTAHFNIKSVKMRLEQLTKTKLQNYVAIYFALREPINIPESKVLSGQESALDLQNGSGESYSGQLALIQSLFFNIEEDFSGKAVEVQQFLEQLSLNLVTFLEDQNFVNGKYELANLYLFLLQNVL